MRAPHVVGNLYWAKTCPPPPGRDGPHRRTGTKALGLAYERKVAEALTAQAPTKVYRGRWFEYCDRGTVRHCQPDVMLRYGEEVLVVEVKLSDTPVAYTQLRGLYLPVAREVFGRQVRGVVVAKHVKRDSRRTYGTIQEALAATTSDGIGLVHWLGTGPLW